MTQSSELSEMRSRIAEIAQKIEGVAGPILFPELVAADLREAIRPRVDAAQRGWMETDCMRCDEQRMMRAAAAGDTAGALMRRMIVCPECGDKRCPKAFAHWNECANGTHGRGNGEDCPICQRKNLPYPFLCEEAGDGSAPSEL